MDRRQILQCSCQFFSFMYRFDKILIMLTDSQSNRPSSREAFEGCKLVNGSPRIGQRQSCFRNTYFLEGASAKMVEKVSHLQQNFSI